MRSSSAQYNVPPPTHPPPPSNPSFHPLDFGGSHLLLNTQNALQLWDEQIVSWLPALWVKLGKDPEEMALK